MQEVEILDSLDKIVIRLHRLPTYYKGTNLVRSQANRYKNMIGKVLQVGSQVYKTTYVGEYLIKPEDEVIFKDWKCLVECSWAGKNKYMIHKNDIIGVVVR